MTLANMSLEIGIGLRVDVHNGCSEHCDRPPTHFECRFVGNSVGAGS